MHVPGLWMGPMTNMILNHELCITFSFSNQIELLYGSDDVGYTPAILTHETLCAILE